jgi:hypothetical protein
VRVSDRLEWLLTKCSLTVCNSDIHIVLLAVLIYGEAFEGEVSTRPIVWLNGSWKV